MSHAMALRYGFAVLSALLGGVWLTHSPRRPFSATWTLRARVLTVGFCAFWSFTWLGLALTRIRYPYELEWIGGGMHDHCTRVLAGLPLYVPPGPGWFPYEYPPLYFWVCALAMKLTGSVSYAPMRAVSILSTLGSAGLLFAWTRRRIVQRAQTTQASHQRLEVVWGLIAAGVFLATYRFTGAWYDAERLDMLFLFLSLLGVYWLECAQAMAHTNILYPVLSAVAFALAFLTKQQAVLFVLGGVGALAWSRSWHNLALFGMTASALCLGSTLLLNRATDGWFVYYCFHVPLANGILRSGVVQYLFDLLLFSPLIILIVFGVLAESRKRSGEIRQAIQEMPMDAEEASMDAEEASMDAEEMPMDAGASRATDAILIAMTAMAVLGSLLSRAHWGGDQNVLIAGYVFLGTAACVLAARWEQRQEQVGLPLYGLVLAQLVTLTYQPMLQIPHTVNYAAGARYTQLIRDLEREGEVLCLDHGGLTTLPHFQTMGLRDVMATEKRLPDSISAALHAHRYAAIVTDGPPPSSGYLAQLSRDYIPVQCLEMTTTWVVTGYPTPNPHDRVWILRPRNRPTPPIRRPL